MKRGTSEVPTPNTNLVSASVKLETSQTSTNQDVKQLNYLEKKKLDAKRFREKRKLELRSTSLVLTKDYANDTEDK